VGKFTHPVGYKGSTFYLSEALFNVWNALELAAMPLVVVAALLIHACNTFERRIKRRLWEAEAPTDRPQAGD
jgi:hypothetical protein